MDPSAFRQEIDAFRSLVSRLPALQHYVHAFAACREGQLDAEAGDRQSALKHFLRAEQELAACAPATFLEAIIRAHLAAAYAALEAWSPAADRARAAIKTASRTAGLELTELNARCTLALCLHSQGALEGAVREATAASKIRKTLRDVESTPLRSLEDKPGEDAVDSDLREALGEGSLLAGETSLQRFLSRLACYVIGATTGAAVGAKIQYVAGGVPGDLRYAASALGGLIGWALRPSLVATAAAAMFVMFPRLLAAATVYRPQLPATAAESEQSKRTTVVSAAVALLSFGAVANLGLLVYILLEPTWSKGLPVLLLVVGSGLWLSAHRLRRAPAKSPQAPSPASAVHRPITSLQRWFVLLRLAPVMIDLYLRGGPNMPPRYYARACERIAKLTEQAWGEGAPQTIGALRMQGLAYREMANPEAERCLRRSLDLAREVFTPPDRRITTLLNDLAAVCRILERRAEAESLYREAWALDERLYGPLHHETISDISNLAMMLADRRHASAEQRAEARVLKLLVVTADCQNLPPRDQAILSDYTSLAGLLLELGDWPGAERQLRLELALLDRFHPVLTIQRAQTVSALAGVIQEQGPARLDEAAALLRQVLDHDEVVLGPQHPDVAGDLLALALLEARRGNWNSILPLLRRAFPLVLRHVGDVSAMASEADRMAFLAVLHRVTAEVMTLTERIGSELVTERRAATAAAADFVLKSKGLGLEALVTQRDAVLMGHYPHLRMRLERLIRLRRQGTTARMAKLMSGRAADTALLRSLDAQRSALEAEIAHAIPEMDLQQRLRGVDIASVARALPPGSALVELVLYRPINLVGYAYRRDPPFAPDHYAAFVLPAGAPERLGLVDLGPAAPIVEHMTAYLEELDWGRQRRDVVRQRGATTTRSESGLALRAALLDPLVSALCGRRRVFLALDGPVANLPWEVLPLDAGHAIDAFDFSYLGCGRDILRFAAPQAAESGPPLVVADPDFDLRATAVAEASRSPSDMASRIHRSAGLPRLARLPGTRAEGKKIAAQLGVDPWLKAKALKGCIKEIRSPRLLHIATHGVFLPNSQPTEEDRAAEVLGQRFAGMPRPVPEDESPLLRSMLALAGVNTWALGLPVPAKAEDGLLTAEDVTGMDLIGTRLVVLSACDTGLGQTQPGEGVLGLQRAFLIAGAPILVVSLWRVSDSATVELMVEFYRRILGGESCAGALDAARRELRKAHPHPGIWGPFVLVGNPGPLQ